MCHRIVPITLEEAQDIVEQMARGGRAFARPDGQGRWAEAPADAYPGSPVPVIVPGGSLAFAEGAEGAGLAAPGTDGLPDGSTAPRGSLAPEPEGARPAQRREREGLAENPGLKALVLSWGVWGRPASGQPPVRKAPPSSEPPAPDRPPAPREGARPQGAKLVFNTRLDTALRQLSEGRGMWAGAMASGRCLVPVRAFFERGGRDVRFSMPGAGAFLLAGVAQGGRFSIVTTDANAAVSPVHGRMPLVLGRGESAAWLDGGPGLLAALGDRSGVRLASDPPVGS